MYNLNITKPGNQRVSKVIYEFRLREVIENSEFRIALAIHAPDKDIENASKISIILKTGLA